MLILTALLVMMILAAAIGVILAYSSRKLHVPQRRAPASLA